MSSEKKKYTVVTEEVDGVLSLRVIHIESKYFGFDITSGESAKEAINAFLIAKRNRLASLKNQIYMTEQAISLAEKLL